MKTFREQFDKLVKAYMNDKVRPWDACACFVGNLLNNTNSWAYCREAGLWGVVELNPDPETIESILIEGDGTYTPHEILSLEECFMKSIGANSPCSPRRKISEERLFEAFEKTLLLLREIHESKGEVVEDYSFTKRELV